MTFPSELTMEEEAIAFAAAHPAPPVPIMGHGLGGPELTLHQVACGVGLIDYYFCAALSGLCADGEHVSAETRIDAAWMFAILAVKRRPTMTPPPSNGPRPALLR